MAPATQRITTNLPFGTLLAYVAFWVLLAPAVAAQDWAQMGHYKAENQRLIDSGASIRAVIIGDSITEDWVEMRPHFFRDTGFVGRGIGGQTTPQMLIRFRQDVIELGPEIVVIHAGINDIAGNTGPMTVEETFGHIKSMAQLAAASGIRVVLTNVLPAAKFPWRMSVEPSDKIPRLNSLLAEYAEAESITLVNFYSIMTDGNNAMREAFSEDGLHPNGLGYAAMERRLSAAISKITPKVAPPSPPRA